MDVIFDIDMSHESPFPRTGKVCCVNALSIYVVHSAHAYVDICCCTATSPMMVSLCLWARLLITLPRPSFSVGVGFRDEFVGQRILPLLLDLRCPSLDAVAFTADFYARFDAAHAFCFVQEWVVGHATGVGSISWLQLEHGQ